MTNISDTKFNDPTGLTRREVGENNTKHGKLYRKTRHLALNYVNFKKMTVLIRCKHLTDTGNCTDGK